MEAWYSTHPQHFIFISDDGRERYAGSSMINPDSIELKSSTLP
jgi:hypothetical protein